MILIDKNIKELAKQNKLIIDNYEEKNVNAISYDLRVNKSIKVESIHNELWKEHREYPLKSGEYIFIETKETIAIPNNMTGKIIDKYSLTILGLQVSNVTYFPGHVTKCYLRVTNVSEKTIVIKENFKIAQIMFEELKEEPEVPYNEQKEASYNDEQTFIGLGKKYQKKYQEIIKDEKAF